MLLRAVNSVMGQTVEPQAVAIALDTTREGAARTRNRALQMATTKWVAFLDDDDEFLPQHLNELLLAAEDLGVDVVYPWFAVPNGFDPFRVDGERVEGRPFDAHLKQAILEECNFIPITVLARRELLMDHGGFPEPYSQRWPHDANEDWGMWKELLRDGARFVHVPQRTWLWHWHGGNTTGRAE